jgi:amino acid adenylation domain-containing protein
MLAVKVVSRVRQVLGVELGVTELFAHTSLGALAAAVGQAAQSQLPAITLASRENPLPLSFAQQRLWFLSQMEGVSQAYHIPLGLRMQGTLDRSALCQALDRIVARHEALRTSFVLEHGQPVQRIAPADIGFALQERDLRNAQDGEATLAAIAEVEAGAPFDLAAGPLVRGQLIRVADDEHVLLVTMHHIVSDGWSQGILINEFSTLYNAYRDGRDDPLPALAIQYADYAAWQRRWIDGEVLQAQAAYWQKTLAGAPALLQLPSDRPRPPHPDVTGSGVDIELDVALTQGLKDLSARHGTTLFMTVLAGWAALLARLSGQDDIVIGTPVAGRTRAEVEPLIGFFLNTLALRIDLSGEQSVAGLLRHVKDQALAAQGNQDLPFEQVVEVVNPPRSVAHHPLFQVLINWQNNQASELKLNGLTLSSADATYDLTKFDLALNLTEMDGQIIGAVTYATSLFDRATIERCTAQLRQLLQAMVLDDRQQVDSLPLLPPDERTLVVDTWNATRRTGREGRFAHQLFEAQAARSPDAVAVACGEARMAYRELDAQANRLAHHLRALGVGPDTRVAICMMRGIDMVLGMLAILKAGGAYVPVDPGYPAQRLGAMLQECAPTAILTRSSVIPAVAPHAGAVPLIDLQADAAAWHEQPSTAPEQTGLRPDHLAYVIFTSGSTGTPKAAQVQHRGLQNLLDWYLDDIGVSHQDRVLLVTSHSFDLTQKNIFAPLAVGATLHLADEPFDAQAILAQVAAAGITHLNLAPSAFHALVDADVAGPQRRLGSLRRLVLGGEPIQPAKLALLPQPRAQVINSYGPTECSDVVASYQLSDDLERYQAHGVPLGKPIRNLRLYLLDRQGQPVPIGVVGEIHIGGAGVGRGYLNRPGMTAERFLPDPFSRDGSRMYQTGDLGRYLPDGSIAFLGRNDFQVKIRGFRIEPGEIEARLLAQDGVREAVVLARNSGPGASTEERQLVAYYTTQPGVTLEADALRAALAAQLPEHMVPAACVPLEALPLTPNGKLDRNALPDPQRSASAGADDTPRGDIETALARIWAEVLKIEQVGRDDDFFDLGGHSLLAERVTSRIRQVLGVEVRINQLFVRPVLRDFADVVRQAARSALPPITPVERSDALVLSFAQQRLWFLAQMEGVSQAYHMPLGLRLEGALDTDALRRALDRIVARHEALRTTFVMRDGTPLQRIADAQCDFALREHDLDLQGQSPDALDALVAQEAGAPFDLEAGPLIRGRLIRLADEEHVLLVTMHHIVSDGWSQGILINEFSALYNAYRAGRDDPLPALSIQYADYAAWQRRWITGEVLQAQTAYWQQALADAPVLLQLPTDHPRPAQQDYAGAFVEWELDAALTQGLKALSQRHGTTLFMTLLAGWATLLARLSGQDDVVIGTPMANRTRAEVEPLIGFFVNTLALRIDLTGSPTVAQLLQAVKARTLEAQQHQDLPFEQVVEIVNPPRSLAHSPLFQVTFYLEQQRSGDVRARRLERDSDRHLCNDRQA